MFASNFTSVEPTVERWVNVTREVYPSVIHPYESAIVTINISVEGGPAVIPRPVAVMFVIDISGSMNWKYENETGGLNSALYYVKNAAKTFIDQMDLINDTVGVVSFARTATLNQGLTHDGEAAKNAIDELTANGATNTGEGIRFAQEELAANSPLNASPIILLFTDGLPTAYSSEGTSCYGDCPNSNNSCTDYARFQANNSKDNNTIIFSIGFTGGITAGGCNADSIIFANWLLKDIASDEEHYYGAINATDIEEIYQNISQEIYKVELSGLVVSEYVPSDFIIVDSGGGSVNVLPNGTQKIEFTRSSISLNNSWNIEFKITTHKLGSFLTSYDNSNLTYRLDNTSYTKYLPIGHINVSQPLKIEINAPKQVNQRERFNYTINLTNIGHMNLYNVTLSGFLSNKTIFYSIGSNYSNFNESNWKYNNDAFILNITNISIDIGEKICFNISVIVSNEASGYIESSFQSGYSTLMGYTVWDICNKSDSILVNNPPCVPNNELPKNGTMFSTGDKPSSLSWSGGDPDNDTTTYYVYLRKDNSTFNTSHLIGITNTTSYNISINWRSKYYWGIIAVDEHGAAIEGPIWWFKTDIPYAEVYTSTMNQIPLAHASASETIAYAGVAIQFNASESYDVDGEIINYTWDFDDGENGYGKVTNHTFSNYGAYNVTLVVTDDDGAKNIDIVKIVILKANYPPSKPVIDGPKNGHKNTIYNFTIFSFDTDNDTIQYVIEWGDDNKAITDFLPNGTSTFQVHSWENFGEYIITVKAYDGEVESETMRYTLLIDVIAINDGIRGYLVDENSDEEYDFFKNLETGMQTDIEIENSTYLIDSDGDNKWDHVYNLDTGLSTYLDYLYKKYEEIFYREIEKTPGFELTTLLVMIALILIIIRKKLNN